jgi:hypothetical protein
MEKGKFVGFAKFLNIVERNQIYITEIEEIKFNFKHSISVNSLVFLKDISVGILMS